MPEEPRPTSRLFEAQIAFTMGQEASQHQGTRVTPVYADDGVTVIGQSIDKIAPPSKSTLDVIRSQRWWDGPGPQTVPKRAPPTMQGLQDPRGKTSCPQAVVVSTVPSLEAVAGGNGLDRAVVLARNHCSRSLSIKCEGKGGETVTVPPGQVVKLPRLGLASDTVRIFEALSANDCVAVPLCELVGIPAPTVEGPQVVIQLRELGDAVCAFLDYELPPSRPCAFTFVPAVRRAAKDDEKGCKETPDPGRALELERRLQEAVAAGDEEAMRVVLAKMS